MQLHDADVSLPGVYDYAYDLRYVLKGYGKYSAYLGVSPPGPSGARL
ncbi:MAG: hypothetical protein L7H09_06065 [Acidilobus sp.]|nr:hypothetical protein [Acidilobus sp.]